MCAGSSALSPDLRGPGIAGLTPKRATDLRPESIAIHAGRPGEEPGEPLNPPLVMASTFRAGGARTYARGSGNPTWEALEEAVGALEGGDAVAFSSGMGAVAAILDWLPQGARVVYPSVSYLNFRALLAERRRAGRLEAVAVDITDTEATLGACQGAALLWIESPTNPLLGLADLAALAEGAHRAGAEVLVDNTFATPLLQQPLALGADISLHSASKFIGGHSDLLLGVVACRDPARADALRHARHLAGATPGTLEAWLALRGLRTMPVRLHRSEENARELADRLRGHPEIERVLYPGLRDHPGHQLARRQMLGFGAMLALEASGGEERAEALCANVGLLCDATSLGGVETTLERRARWPGEELISPGLVRVSVGCEHIDDIWDDLAAALRASTRVVASPG
jgi:cystathionine gamma-synthase